MKTVKAKLAISSKRPFDQKYYDALNANSDHHWTTELEEWQICLLYDCGAGFHCRTIARWIYGNGNPKYNPSETEVGRVNRILRANGRSQRDWRDGKTPEARSRIVGVLRQQKQSIRLVQRTA